MALIDLVSKRGGPRAAVGRSAPTQPAMVDPLEPRRLLAASPSIVADLNTRTAASVPTDFTVVGDTAYFYATDLEHGTELWKTDGTTGGTSLVKDLNPGLGSAVLLSARVPFPLAALGPTTLVFAADDGVHGRELWRTDGTDAGTRLLKDIIPGTGGSVALEAAPFVGAGGVVYFDASSTPGQLSRDLWKTDGTEAGTMRVAPSTLVSNPTQLTASGDALFFVTGTSLWKTDGTAAGTILLARLVGAGGENFGLTAGPPGTIFFLNRDATGAQLWKSDGTVAGTIKVKTIRDASPTGSSPFNFKFVDGTLYFSAADDAHGRELWKSDGTEAGTVLVKDLNPGTGSGFTGVVWEAAGKIYFSATDGVHGIELWTTDGTEAGTVMVADLNPGPADSRPAQVVATDDGTVYFTAEDLAHGSEVWKIPPQATPVAAVVGRHVFYSGSSFGNAVATDKVALLRGEPATFANVTSYTKGINGVVIDVYPAVINGLSADDFEFQFASATTPDRWAAAPAPASLDIRFSPIPEQPARITLTWPDGAIQNGWLRMTLKANDHTRLAKDDVFAFGNVVGETGDGSGAAGWRVSALDLAAVKRALNAAATVTAKTDFNSDGRTNALDLAIVRRALNQALPPPPAFPAASAEPARRRVADEVLA